MECIDAALCQYPPGPVGRDCWSRGYSFRSCCPLQGEEAAAALQESCWDGYHTEERCCRGLVAPPSAWRAVHRTEAKEAVCLEAMVARAQSLVAPETCEGRYFYVAQLGRPRLRPSGPCGSTTV